MKEDKNESRWDKLLNIRTMGRDDTHADQYRYPYEPTPYSVLERLANAGYIRKGNILLDYGCGKGRVQLNVYQKNARAISFYQREGVIVQCEGLDEATGEKEYTMLWKQK